MGSEGNVPQKVLKKYENMFYKKYYEHTILQH